MTSPTPQALPYSPPLSILSQQPPLPTHITLEPLPAFAPTFGSAVLMHRSAPAPEADLWGNYFPSPPNSSAQLLSAARKPGRKVSKINKTLRLFTRSDPAYQTKSPKLENIRYRVMRTLKKTLRRLFERRTIKRKGLLEMQCKTDELDKCLADFKQYARNHREVLEDFSQLINGPKVDQSRNPQSTTFSTYNNSYMEYVFQTPEVRSIYQLFIKLIYSVPESDSLSHRFFIKCCKSEAHSSDCITRWEEFRRLLVEYMGTKVLESR